MQPEYRKIDVPPHLIKLFNEVFQREFAHCKLYMRQGLEKYSDGDMWSVMVDSLAQGIMDDEDDVLEDDWKPSKPIVWH